MESDLLSKHKDQDIIKPLLPSITENLKLLQLISYYIGDKFPILYQKHRHPLFRDSIRIKI